MARATYDDADKARVIAHLLANNGNVKRSARETGVPISTVRDWKTEMEKEGIPDSVRDALPAVVDDIVVTLQRVRDKALLELERLVDNQELKGRELVGAIGMLTDKILLFKGEATSRHETKVALPEPDQLRELMAGFFTDSTQSQQKRAAEIELTEGADFWESAEEALPTAQEE